jgi:CheY-like chemotaxis protein
MARVAIGEPYAEVRELLVRVVEGAGWQAVVDAREAEGADALLIEPGDAASFELARRLRESRPDLPLVCVSIYPPGPETEPLSPSAYLLKPFSVAELQRVLAAALDGHASRPSGSATAALSHQTQ